MTQLNNEFEKWATKHIVSKRLLELNTMKYENGMYKSHIMQRKFEAWNAAKADSEREIAELRAENKQIDAINASLQFIHEGVNCPACGSMAVTPKELWYTKQIEKLQAKNSELSVSINVLREALESLLDYGKSPRMSDEIAWEVLRATPAQSLQAHDDEVIERCAEICISIQPDYVDNSVYHECAKAIQALKGK